MADHSRRVSATVRKVTGPLHADGAWVVAETNDRSVRVEFSVDRPPYPKAGSTVTVSLGYD